MSTRRGRPGARRGGRGAAGTAAGALLAAASLSACGATGTATPAPQASSSACRAALAAAPRTVLGAAGAVTGPGTAQFGDPAIQVRCGLAEPVATTDACLQVDDVDWVAVGDGQSDPIVFVSYGRSPALEVSVPAHYGRTSASGALVDVKTMVAALPTTGHHCD